MIRYSNQPDKNADVITDSPTSPIVPKNLSAAESDLDLDSDDQNGTD
jgi:hypothetical protein